MMKPRPDLTFKFLSKASKERTKKTLVFQYLYQTYCSYFLNELTNPFSLLFQSETASCKNVGEYWVNKSLITNESKVFETMLSGANEWAETMQFASGSNIDKFITVSDTKRVTLEAYLVFCYSGYVPMSAIGQVSNNLIKCFHEFCHYESHCYFTRSNLKKWGLYNFAF